MAGRPHQAGGVLAAADRVEGLAHPGALQHQAAEQERADREVDGISEAGQRPLPEAGERGAPRYEEGVGTLVGDRQQQPARAEQAGQGDDEGGHPGLGDEDAVDRADQAAHGQRQEQRRQ